MSRTQGILKWSLLSGSLYFLGVALAHLLQAKVPGLYVYYDTPSVAYQDQIVAIFAFGWSAFYFTAFTAPERNRGLITAILLSGALAILGLCSINARVDIDPSLAPAHRTVYWIETAALFLFWLWLLILHSLASLQTSSPDEADGP